MSQKVTKRIFWIGIPLATCALLAGTVAVGARGGAFHGGFHKGLHQFLKPDRIQQIVSWKVDDFLDQIEANEAQRTQIHAIKDRLLDEGMAFHGQMADPHRAILDELKKETPDMQAIYAQIDEGAERKKDFARRVADAVVEVHSVLTPEQRDLIAAEIEGKMANMESFLHGH